MKPGLSKLEFETVYIIRIHPLDFNINSVSVFCPDGGTMVDKDNFILKGTKVRRFKSREEV